jgi:hypothetical protein
VEPAAQGLAVVAFAAEGVAAAEAVVDVRYAVFEQRLVVLVVDAPEITGGDALHDGVIHLFFPILVELPVNESAAWG